MKVLFLRTDFYGHVSEGGSFSHIKGFLKGLSILGHECVVLSSGDLSVGHNNTLFRIPYPSLFRNLPEVPSIAYNFKLFAAACSIIEKERPDFIYHRHSEFNYTSARLSRHFGLPLVLEFNGSEVWVKKNWGALYLERICRNAENFQLENATLIAVVSDLIKQDLIRRGIDSKKILVNPNGADPDIFHPSIDGSEIRKRYRLSKKTIVAGFVGTFGQWHGVDILAKSIRATVMRNKNIHFLIVGDGKLRPEVESIIRNDGIGDFVTLTGIVPHGEIPRYLAACDLLLSPHVQNRDGTEFFGSPTKLFEYMAMGKPIIASPVGQIAEVIRDGRNGVLTKPHDPGDLAEKIIWLSRRRTAWRKLGSNAHKDVLRRFSWKQNAARVVETVRTLTSHT